MLLGDASVGALLFLALSWIVALSIHARTGPGTPDGADPLRPHLLAGAVVIAISALAGIALSWYVSQMGGLFS